MNDGVPVTRRTALLTFATAAALGTGLRAQQRGRPLLTFVLVHGAWHGGWCWKKVAPILRADGHLVYTPTLTGLGERRHLASPQVNLSTHIQDVAAPSLAAFGVADPTDVAWATPRITDQPFATFTETLKLPDKSLAGLRSSYIRTSNRESFRLAATRAAAAGFNVSEMADAGHDVMITRPRELATRLVELSS